MLSISRMCRPSMDWLHICRQSAILSIIATSAALHLDRTGVLLAAEEPVVYQTRLYLAEPDGSQLRPLISEPTTIRAQGSPDWAENGELIAFDGWEQDQNNRSGKIMIVKPDGTGLRALIDGLMPSLSPEGKRIAFSRSSPGNYGIWIVSTADPESELVQIEESGWGTDWSPDGTRIAYTKSFGGRTNLCVFNMVEGTKEFLFPEGQMSYRQINWNFAWTPDSRSIVFRGETIEGQPVIAMVDARSSTYGHRVLCEGKMLPAISTRGDSEVIFTQPDPGRSVHHQLFSITPGAMNPERLPGVLPAYGYYDTCSSPDGKKLLITIRVPKGTPAPELTE